VADVTRSAAALTLVIVDVVHRAGKMRLGS
jgi:hypothetical protein